MDRREAIARLVPFIKSLARSRVKDAKGWKSWRKKEGREAFLEDIFAYKRGPDMPRITALVAPHFHPELPLIGLNYTPVAHNTLHEFPEGWTKPLRQCRGIVFDRKGNLVALPFEKFFNYGERAETSTLPDGEFEATEKLDGHLGIVFKYGERLVLETRGSFISASAKLGNEMLAAANADGAWDFVFADCVLTLLVEIIHPATHVQADYGEREQFVLIGAVNGVAHDFKHGPLALLAGILGIPAAQTWKGGSLADLVALMKSGVDENKEGYVLRFGDERIKVKNKNYLARMFMKKLDYAYLMRQIIAGTFDEKVGMMDFEGQSRAKEITDDMNRALDLADEKARRQYLYGLVPPERSTQYYRGICRQYLKWLEVSRKSA